MQEQEHPPRSGERPEQAGGQREFMRYAFYKVTPEWRRLEASERCESKREFASVVALVSEAVSTRPFSLAGIRGDVDFMLWMRSPSLDDLKRAGERLNATHLGRFSSLPYSYLAITRPSPYLSSPRERPKEAQFEKARYLFVYPFVKTRAWYALPQHWRKAMMLEHIGIGAKYPSVRINTGYSYGLDDQEHMVSFETESPSDFVDLVMALRESQQSSYTLRDTPVFTCVSAEMPAILDSIAG